MPGDVVTAIMLGALMIQGMTPGPLLFQEQGTLVYSIFIALFVSNVFMLLLGYYAVRLFAKVVLIPGGILMPLVTTLCVVGGYALNNSNFDLAVMAGFRVARLHHDQGALPARPLLLAMILSRDHRNQLPQGAQHLQSGFLRILHLSCLRGVPRHQPLHPVQPALEGMEEVPRRQRRLIPQPL